MVLPTPQSPPPTSMQLMTLQSLSSIPAPSWRSSRASPMTGSGPSTSSTGPPPPFSLPPPTTFATALARTIDILGKHFEFPLAWSLLDSERNLLSPSPDLLRPAFRSLFNRLAAAHLVSEALDAHCRAADEFGLRDHDTFHLLVDALCDHRHVPEAEDLCLRRGKGLVPGSPPPFQPDTKTYNLLLRGWLKMEWWSKCRDFWEEMDLKGIEKDLHSYSNYMDALTKSDKPWKSETKKKSITFWIPIC